MACVALYEEDQCWYRGTITSCITPEYFEVGSLTFCFLSSHWYFIIWSFGDPGHPGIRIRRFYSAKWIRPGKTPGTFWKPRFNNFLLKVLNFQSKAKYLNRKWIWNKRVDKNYHSPKVLSQGSSHYMSICCESPPAVFIQVRFVDFGNSALLPSSNLRPIYEDLMDLPAQVLGCCVADVKPNDKSWTEGIPYS